MILRHHSKAGRQLLREVGKDGARLRLLMLFDGRVLVDPELAEPAAIGIATLPGLAPEDGRATPGHESNEGSAGAGRHDPRPQGGPWSVARPGQSGRELSDRSGKLPGMELTARDIEKIPAENIRVRRAHFAAVWLAAEQRNRKQAAAGSATGTPLGGGDLPVARHRHHAAGARSVVPGPLPSDRPHQHGAAGVDRGRGHRRGAAGHATAQAAVAGGRPGWAESIKATFNWAWRRIGPPPLPIEQPSDTGAAAPPE